MTEPAAVKVVRVVEAEEAQRVLPEELRERGLGDAGQKLLRVVDQRVFERVGSDRTEAMRKEVFPDRINQAKQFLTPLGPYKAFTLVEYKEEGKQRTLRYKVSFADMTLVLTGTLTEDGKIAGLTITPD